MSAAFWSFSDFTMAHRGQGGEHVIVERLSLDVPAGGFYLLVGSSGGGKSSLLRLAAGLFDSREPPPRTAGRFSCLGHDVRQGPPPALQRKTAAILQEEGLFDDLSPRANVELALRAAGRSVLLAPALLAEVGLDQAPPRIADLSGGMRKRLCVARALAVEPQALYCDEPLAGLDPASARQIAVLLRRAHDRQQGRTTLIVTHDIEAFENVHDGVLELDRDARTLRLHGEGFRWRPTGTVTRELRPGSDLALAQGARRALLAVGAASHTLWKSLVRLPPVELRLAAQWTWKCIHEPLLFVAFANAAIGGMTTFFALRNNPVQGGFESDLLAGAGKVICAVMAPLMSSFFFTARIAAGATARIGTMARTQQITALRLLGVDPADHLLTPMVWGMALGLPIVTVFGVVAASLAALWASSLVSGISTIGWSESWFRNVDAADLRLVLTKALLAGFLVAVVCYHLGSGPKRSGDDVGTAVNRAIVVGMGLALAVHALLTVLVYA